MCEIWCDGAVLQLRYNGQRDVQQRIHSLLLYHILIIHNTMTMTMAGFQGRVINPIYRYK